MRILTQWTLSHKRLIAGVWLLITVIGIAATQPATNALTDTFTLPGQPGYDTNQAILKLYGDGGRQAPVVPVITLPVGVTVDTAGVRDQLAATLERVERAVPGARLVSYASSASSLIVSADRRTTFALVYPPNNGGGMLGMRMGASTSVEQAAQRVLAQSRIDGAPFHLTSTDLLETNASKGSSRGGGMSAMGMTMMGMLGALVVLAFVFGSVLAVVPIAMAVIAITTTFLLVWGLTRRDNHRRHHHPDAARAGIGIAVRAVELVAARSPGQIVWIGCAHGRHIKR